MRVDAIILARGGSKGIPKKNIVNFCGKPLIAWTIEQCKQAKSVNSVWVSSDDLEILAVAKNCGAEIPRWLSHKAEALKNTPEELQSFYIETVSTLCEKLLTMGAPGLHFYTMNQADHSLEICKNLGIEV